MRIRLAGLLAGLATAVVAVIAGAAPATAAPAAHQVHPMVSAKPVAVHFYNDGWYWAYADVWGYDGSGREVYHDWSGSVGHTGNRWFTVPAGVASVHWQVRMEPFGNTIHQQTINPWYDFNDYCTDGKHATIYVGGTAGSTNDYDLHCSNW
ncbi:hypothetical protein HC031_20265 [Planosporangium thailandense]|uniref:Uncharacterized protein n=1 Tax=Planosporangium thailandense TaxID=765197 RepID=A0ABX0Y1W4_9ACTN|nr:hypothetical protein [Planosporangium thailandense]NJC72033.1 hypothetical protein [Planosporangium thailandense]